MPAHDGGEVVELEERGQPLRVVLPLLQPLDDAELPLDQPEGAQREVDERATDPGAHALQLGRGLGEFAAQLLARVGHLLPLADEMLAVGLQRGDPLGECGGVRVQGVDGPDDLRELVVAAGEGDRLLRGGVLRLGEAGGAAAQDRQRPGERARHRRGDTDGEQHQGAEDGDPHLQLGDVLVAQLGEILGALFEEAGLHPAHRVDPRGERGRELLRAGVEFAVGEGGRVGEPCEVLLGGVDLGSVDRGVVGGAGGLGRALAEVGEGGVGAQPGLERGGGQRVTPLGVGLRGGSGRRRQAGDRVDHGPRGARHAQRGEQQSAGGGGLLDGAVQLGERVGSGAGPGRCLFGQLFGEPVQLGDGGGVGLMRFEGAALPAERGPAHGGDGVEFVAQRLRGVGVGAQLLDLPVDAGAVLLGGRLGLGAAGRDVGDDLVALVGEGVGEAEGVLSALGERHQVLRVTEPAGGGDDGRRPGSGDRGGHHGHGDDEPVAYVRGAAPADGGLLLRVSRGSRLLAFATRPRLLHRCSHS